MRKSLSIYSRILEVQQQLNERFHEKLIAPPEPYEAGMIPFAPPPIPDDSLSLKQSSSFSDAPAASLSSGSPDVPSPTSVTTFYGLSISQTISLLLQIGEEAEAFRFALAFDALPVFHSQYVNHLVAINDLNKLGTYLDHKNVNIRREVWIFYYFSFVFNILFLFHVFLFFFFIILISLQTIVDIFILNGRMDRSLQYIEKINDKPSQLFYYILVA